MTRIIRTRTAAIAAIALLAAGLGAGSATADDSESPPEPVEVVNQDFSSGDGGWWAYDNSLPEGESPMPDLSDGAFCISTNAEEVYDAGVGTNGLEVPAGTATLTFDAKGLGDYKAAVQVPDETPTFSSPFTVEDADEYVEHTFEFAVPEGSGAAVKFEVGGAATPLCLDNIVLTVIESGDAGNGGDDEEPTDPLLYAGVNLLRNGDFSNDTAGWSSYGHIGEVVDGQYCGTVTGPMAYSYDAGFGYNGLELPAGDYVLSFEAATTGTFNALVQEDGGAYAWYAGTEISGSDVTPYEIPFTVDATEPNATLQFHFGPLDEGESYEFCLDNIYLGAPAVQYVPDDSFDSWDIDGADQYEVEDGTLCVAVPGGTTNPWDVNIHLDHLDLPAGPYALTFDASGTGGPMRAIVGLGAEPYTVYAELNATPTEDMTPYTLYFTMQNGSDNAQIAFQVGGSSNSWDFCLENVSLMSGGEAPAYEPETGPALKVNQHGYETAGPKRATLVTEATDPVTWELVDAGSNATTASGVSTPHGVDPTAGENVHVIDFAGSHPAGTYVLRAEGEDSHPFTIAAAQYTQLRYDALNYFYLARSGTDIEASIVGDEYARGAGHASDANGSDVNKGDYNVACQPADDSQGIYGEPWTCDYTLDVVGGWYDAGDHGKYVVNGGISVAQVMGTYERLLRASESDRAALGDSTLKLPETGNGVPDALDEARWQLDFMTSMMVPEGKPLAGMVHHKVHDFGWSPLPLLPENAGGTRYLHRPSTAATLNVAATAAQGARLWQPYDADYAQSLLDVAERTWAAALENPELYAPVADGDFGGGPYDDDDVTDEFYWAAAELFITTGDSAYEQFLLNSPVHTAESFIGPGLNWFSMGALAKMNLATVDNDFSGRAAIANQVVAAGKAIRDIQRGEPFGQAMGASGYDWGSSSDVLNNIVILGAAYDLSGDASILAAAQESMDYLLGRNALGQSYITGYGTQYSKNQHSRWFASQLNSEYPHPPAGSVAGGPNRMANTWDPTFAALYPNADCAPQKCYLDDIQSWATNEITINWNSALSAAVGFLAAPDAPASISSGGDTPGTGDGDGKSPLPEDQVKKSDDGGIDVPASAYVGETITIGMGEQHIGTATQTYLYSEPALIGQSIVDTDGNIRVTIPLETTPGAHTIAVYDTDGNLLGWAPIEILAVGDGTLPVTGAEGYLTSLVIALVLVFAGVAMVLRREQIE